MLPYLRVEFGGALEGVGLLAERLALGRRAGGSGPVDGCASNAPLQVTERSPRMLIVSSAFSWPAFADADPHAHLVHDARIGTVGSIRP